jgi:hypothetical protein
VRRRFPKTELKAAIALWFLAVLAQPILPAERTSGRGPGQEAFSRLDALGTGLRVYLWQHNGVLPPLWNPTAVRRALEPDGPSMRRFPGRERLSILMDSATDTPFVPNARLSLRPLQEFAAVRGTTVVFYQRWGTGPLECRSRLALLLDGEVVSVDGPEWERLRRASGIPASPLE